MMLPWSNFSPLGIRYDVCRVVLVNVHHIMCHIRQPRMYIQRVLRVVGGRARGSKAMTQRLPNATVA